MILQSSKQHSLPSRLPLLRCVQALLLAFACILMGAHLRQESVQCNHLLLQHQGTAASHQLGRWCRKYILWSAALQVHTVEGGNHGLDVKGGKAATTAARADILKVIVSFAQKLAAAVDSNDAEHQGPPANEAEPAKQPAEPAQKRARKKSGS